MKLIVAGSREITDKEFVRDKIAKMLALLQRSGQEITEIVHGGCRGVDSIAHDICEGLYPIKVFPADWKTHGRAAGPIRNRQMAEYANCLLAIVREGGSRGTQNMIDEMSRLKKPSVVVTYLEPRPAPPPSPPATSRR